MSIELNELITASTAQGQTHVVGILKASYDGPMYCIELPDGKQIWWGQSLCRKVSAEEEKEFQEDRAFWIDHELRNSCWESTLKPHAKTTV